MSHINLKQLFQPCKSYIWMTMFRIIAVVVLIIEEMDTWLAVSLFIEPQVGECGWAFVCITNQHISFNKIVHVLICFTQLLTKWFYRKCHQQINWYIIMDRLKTKLYWCLSLLHYKQLAHCKVNFDVYYFCICSAWSRGEHFTFIIVWLLHPFGSRWQVGYLNKEKLLPLSALVKIEVFRTI